MAQMQMARARSLPLVHLEPFRGISAGDSPTQVDIHHSPDCLNVCSDEKGALSKRTGYVKAFNSLGAGKIGKMYEYKKPDGTSFFLFTHGGKLYKLDGNPIYLADVTNIEPNFFTMDGKCYIMDGTNFYVYDGSTISQVTPYIPTMQISKNPSGGGVANEDFNLIGNKFKDSFSGDGTATVYQMSLSGLDDTPVTALIGATTINEGSGLTVDRVNGKITFTTAPAQGTNNVIITAGKTVSGYPDRIKKTTMAIGFGGANDTRTFVAGNPNLPDHMFRSGLYDATYWPENGYYRMNEKITGFSKQYDYLIVEKPNGKSVINFQITEEGVVSFPSKPINNKVGTIAPNTIQIIENNPVSLSKDGVYMTVASNVRDERNVVHISGAIDRKLLLETALNNAVSVDFDKKYWLAVNGNVYVLDYTQKSVENPYGEWYVYNNIPASSFLVVGDFLYFGSSTNGIIYRFQKEYENNAYSDDGQPINAYWKSKMMTFNADEYYKNITNLFATLKPASKTSVDLYYSTDKAENVLLSSGNALKFNLFDFDNINFDSFSFIVSTFPKLLKQKVKAKKVIVFQLMIQNNKLDEGMSILSLGIEYSTGNKVR